MALKRDGASNVGTVEGNPRAVYGETFVASDGETQRAYDLRGQRWK